MAKGGTTTIGVKPETKTKFIIAADGRKHDHFVNRLLDIYNVLPPAERIRLLEQAPAPQKG